MGHGAGGDVAGRHDISLPKRLPCPDDDGSASVVRAVPQRGLHEAGIDLHRLDVLREEIVHSEHLHGRAICNDYLSNYELGRNGIPRFRSR